MSNKDERNDPDREPEVIDAASGRPVDTPEESGERIRLNNLKEIRLEMTRIYRKARRGTLDTGEANKLIWALRQIGDLIVDGELEKRLEVIERLEAERLPELIPAERRLN